MQKQHIQSTVMFKLLNKILYLLYNISGLVDWDWDDIKMNPVQGHITMNNEKWF